MFDSLGEYQNAKEYHEKALAIAIEIGDRRGEGTTYGNLGNVFYSLGECQNAKEYHEKALAIAIEIGDRRGEGTRYGNLGSMFASLDEYQNAKEYLEKALGANHLAPIISINTLCVEKVPVNLFTRPFNG